jgi:tyrosyl-tRNA synthetase
MNKKIKTALTRGVDEIIGEKELKKNLLSGKKLRIKLGFDPTSPNLHLGRSIPLLKLKDFQDLGHQVIFIIGDFTGVIGDTSDKDSERPMLSEKQIKKNLETYREQAGKIIDLNKCETRHNSEWLGKLEYHEISRQANIFSLNEFISRENIKKRILAGKRVSLREVLYPLLQGYDSVAVKADLEVGGTDQRFNLLAGRELQRFYGQNPQSVLTNPLIDGLDGRKMSSSWGNTINLLDSAQEMYGKTMSLRDELIIEYFVLTTRIDMKEIEEYEKEIKKGANPRNYKAKLAYEITKMFHSPEKAINAQKNFERVFKEKKSPLKIPLVRIKEKNINILDLLVKIKLAESKAEAKRLINQKGIKINQKIEEDWKKTITITNGMIVQAGKRKFVQISKN